jgi:hypothetical protein
LIQQTKDEAREETLRRWHALPPDDRQSLEQAEFFAAALAGELDFRTMGNSRKIILGWLVRDLAGLPPWGNVPPESVTTAMRQAAIDTADDEDQLDVPDEPANDDQPADEDDELVDDDEDDDQRQAAE